MKYQVRHTTRYDYQEPVSHCYNVGYILPRATLCQKIINSKVIIKPRADQAVVRKDFYGNQRYHFSIEMPHDMLEVTVHTTLEVSDLVAYDLEKGQSCTTVMAGLQNIDDPETLKAREFILNSPFIKVNQELIDYAGLSFIPERGFLVSVLDLTKRIFKDFKYDPGFSTVSTPLSDVLKHKRGVCQDFAHLGVACMRALGYPARYVSGYLETLPPPGTQKLVGADATHAWFAVYSPGEGWFDFDPTNNTMTGGQYITTAWGRDYSDVPPLKGVLFGGGSSSTLLVQVDVNRVVDKVTESGSPAQALKKS